MARARREHRDLLAGMQLRAAGVKMKVPSALRKGKGKSSKSKKQKGSRVGKERQQMLDAEAIARAELKRQKREENERNAARNAEKKQAKQERKEKEKEKLRNLSEKERGNAYREERVKCKMEKKRALEQEERALNGTPGEEAEKGEDEGNSGHGQNGAWIGLNAATRGGAGASLRDCG